MLNQEKIFTVQENNIMERKTTISAQYGKMQQAKGSFVATLTPTCQLNSLFLIKLKLEKENNNSNYAQNKSKYFEDRKGQDLDYGVNPFKSDLNDKTRHTSFTAYREKHNITSNEMNKYRGPTYRVKSSEDFSILLTNLRDDMLLKGTPATSIVISNGTHTATVFLKVKDSKFSIKYCDNNIGIPSKLKFDIPSKNAITKIKNKNQKTIKNNSEAIPDLKIDLLTPLLTQIDSQKNNTVLKLNCTPQELIIIKKAIEIVKANNPKMLFNSSFYKDIKNNKELDTFISAETYQVPLDWMDKTSIQISLTMDDCLKKVIQALEMKHPQDENNNIFSNYKNLNLSRIFDQKDTFVKVETYGRQFKKEGMENNKMIEHSFVGNGTSFMKNIFNKDRTADELFNLYRPGQDEEFLATVAKDHAAIPQLKNLMTLLSSELSLPNKAALFNKIIKTFYAAEETLFTFLDRNNLLENNK